MRTRRAAVMLAMVALVAGCDDYGPANAALSAAVTKDRLARFEASGITEVYVGLNCNCQNAKVTARNRTAGVSVQPVVGGAAFEPFRATLDRTPKGDKIIVYSNVDHTEVSVESMRASVDQGIDQAIDDWQSQKATAATWVSKP